MNFNYLRRIVQDASIEIDNIKECSIIAYNDIAEEFYLMISTDLGVTQILSQGPVSLSAPIYAKCEYLSFQTDAKKIQTYISKWLNDKDKAITQAEEIDREELKEKLVNIADYFGG